MFMVAYGWSPMVLHQSRDFCNNKYQVWSKELWHILLCLHFHHPTTGFKLVYKLLHSRLQSVQVSKKLRSSLEVRQAARRTTWNSNIIPSGMQHASPPRMYAKANVKVNSNLRKRLLLPSLPSLSLSSISWITGRNSSVTVWTDQPQPSLLWRWRPDHQLHGHNYGPMALELITKWLVTTISPIIQSTANSTNILLYESWAITHNSIQVFVPHSDYIFTVMYVTSTNAWCVAGHCRPLHGLTTLGICKVQQRFFRLKSSWNLYLPLRRPRAATTSGTILGTIESLLHEFGDLLCIQASLALFPWRDSVEWQQFWKKAKVNLSKVISNIYLSTL